MSKFNLMLHLASYEDKNPSNNPTKGVVRWTTDYSGAEVSEPSGMTTSLDPMEERTIFNGSVSLDQDVTTEYSIVLKPGTMNSYIFSHSAGTAPNFRQPRVTGADNTTEVMVTKNGPLLTFTSTDGTLFDLLAGNVQIGDEVKIGNDFNPLNVGTYKILSFTQNSFTVNNSNGTEQTLVISSPYQIKIYSSQGVQVGQKLRLNNGFNPLILGTYEITEVEANSLVFFSSEILPTNLNVLAEIFVFTNSKRMIFVESDKKLEIVLDGQSFTMAPNISVSNGVGVFLSNTEAAEFKIRNKTNAKANIFVFTLE